MALGDDEDGLAHRLDLGEDVAAEDDGVLLAQGLDQGADLDDLLGVQAHGGLIQDHHLRVPQQSLGDAHPLAVALGEVLNEAVRHIGDLGHLHDPADLLRQGLVLDSLGPAHEGQVLPGRPVQVQRRLLRQVADKALGLLRLLEDVVAVDADLPLAGGQAPGHDVHGGGFSRAVGTQKAVDLALLDGEGQIRYRGVAAVPLGQMAYFDQCKSSFFS